MAKTFTLGLILVFFCRIGVGQESNNSVISPEKVENHSEEAIAAQHLKKLKEGILVVRMRSDQKKIAKINEFIEQSTDPKIIYKYEVMLKEVTDSQIRDEKNLRLAMKQNYAISEYVFMYDYQTPEFLEGNATFFTEDKKVTLKSLGARDFYVLSTGTSKANGSKIIEILDKDLNPLPYPFPGTISLSGFQGFFSLFSGNELIYDKISKLNKKLLKLEYLNSFQ